MDPTTHTCLERPVHIKNITKYNTIKVELYLKVGRMI